MRCASKKKECYWGDEAPRKRRKYERSAGPSKAEVLEDEEEYIPGPEIWRRMLAELSGMREDIRKGFGELKVVVDRVRKEQVRMRIMLVNMMEEVELQADYIAGVTEKSDSEVSDVAEAEVKELAEEDRMVKEGKTAEVVAKVVVENVSEGGSEDGSEDESEDGSEDGSEDAEMEV